MNVIYSSFHSNLRNSRNIESSQSTSLDFAAFGNGSDVKHSIAQAFWYFLSTAMVCLQPSTAVRTHFIKKNTCVYVNQAAINKQLFKQGRIQGGESIHWLASHPSLWWVYVKLRKGTKLSLIRLCLRLLHYRSLRSATLLSEILYPPMLRGCLSKSGLVGLAWKIDFAHFVCVERLSCNYTKTTIRLTGSFKFLQL